MRYRLDYREYQDKVLAAWLGKSIGGTVGAYVENHKELKHLTAADLWPPRIPPNDDLDIQLVWLEALQERGCWVGSADLVHYWQDRCWYNFCEYGFFLYNVQRGIMPPWSGYWNNEFFRESEGSPIRSDIWGLVAPGNPALAAEFARLDSELDHSGFSVDAERFSAAMTAQALVAATRDEIIAAGLAAVPHDSAVRRVVAETAEIARDFPDFPTAWRIAVRRFGDRDASKAITNLSFWLLAWFSAGEDFRRAMENCINAGWDCDCTAATLGGILGAWKGTAIIPPEWREQLGPTLVCGIEVDHKNALLTDLAAETALLGAEMAIARNDRIELVGAPRVTVRPRPEPRVEISVDYRTVPVLFRAAPTEVVLTLNNPTADAVSGEFAVAAAPGTLISPEHVKLCLAPGEAYPITLRIRRSDPALPLADKNLFHATFAVCGALVAECDFGLGGARQWLVYGPYWDMWDREKYGDECPYSGPGRNSPPGWSGCTGDSYRHYVYLDRPYLDEAALAKGDLAELAPLRLESGVDLLTGEDFGNWFGGACWYLVRTFIAPAGAKLIFNLGREGMIRVWLDGEERYRSNEAHVWQLGTQDIVKFTGTGRPQRLVVKLAAPGDRTALSFNIMRDEELRGRAGISYIADTLVDVVPAIGYHL